MGSTTQIDKAVVAVDGDHLCVRNLRRFDRLDDFFLETMIGEDRQCLLLAHCLAHERLVRLDDLPHLGFDCFEIFRCERTTDVEVVVEAIGDRRADRKGGTGKECQDCLGKDMGRRVAHDAAALVGGVGQDLDRAAVRQWPGQVKELAVELHRHGGLGKAFADGNCDIVACRTIGMFDYRAVG